MTGTDNVILGTNAAENGTSLTRNVIIGDDAARDGTITGKQNIIIGVSGSSKITSGRDNISLGSFAGSALTTGKRNILIGSSSVVAGTADHQVVIGTNASANSANSIAIGQSATVTQANSMVLGSQTGEAFFIGMGGLQAPKATLDVSGSVFVTGSLTDSASNTLKNIGRTVLVANERANSVNVPSLPSNRALEVSGTANFKFVEIFKNDSNTSGIFSLITLHNPIMNLQSDIASCASVTSIPCSSAKCSSLMLKVGPSSKSGIEISSEKKEAMLCIISITSSLPF